MLLLVDDFNTALLRRYRHDVSKEDYGTRTHQRLAGLSFLDGGGSCQVCLDGRFTLAISATKAAVLLIRHSSKASGQPQSRRSELTESVKHWIQICSQIVQESNPS